MKFSNVFVENSLIIRKALVIINQHVRFIENLLKINRKSKFKKKKLDNFQMECLNVKNVEKNMMEVMDQEDFVQAIVEKFILENE
jgi:hypothetical protein